MEEKTMKEQNFTPKTALIIFAIGLAGGLGGFAIANALSPEKESETKAIVQMPATMPTLFDTKSSVAENINFTTAAENVSTVWCTLKPNTSKTSSRSTPSSATFLECPICKVSPHRRLDQV